MISQKQLEATYILESDWSIPEKEYQPDPYYIPLVAAYQHL